MKQGTKFFITLAVLAAVIAAAAVGYNYLSEKALPRVTTPQAHTEGATETKQINTAPDFDFLDGEGETHSLSQFFGKPIIINFWATWCGPCKAELPAFDEMSGKYGDRVSFLMVNLTDGNRETVSGVKEFLSENGYSFPVFYDTMGLGARAYKAYSIPLTVIIDKDGNLYTTHTGMMNGATLEGYIKTILGEK